MKLFIVAILSLLSFYVYAVPSPHQTTAEVLNNVLDDTDTTDYKLKTTSSVDTTGLSSDSNQILMLAELVRWNDHLELTETGTRVDFSVENITDAAFYDLVTLSYTIKKMSVVNNSGGEFYVGIDDSNVGVIAPGDVAYWDMKAATASVIQIKSISGTVSSGKIYINYFK